jgi:hypothetical protein
MTTQNPLEKGAPMPASMGRCADFYSDVRALRLSMEKEVEAIKARESEIREHIIGNLSKSADTGAAGLRYRAQIVMKDVVKVNEWPLVYSWIRKNDRFDFMQKRLSDKAVAEWMQEEKRTLPGTEVIKIPEVSITKI